MLAIVALLLAACRGPSPDGVLVADAEFPAALAPLPDGGILYAERLTGRIRSVTPEGELEPEPVAVLEVSTAGQRGLLGLDVDPDGEDVYAAWTDPGDTLLVGRLRPGTPEPDIIWRGPETPERALGGRIAVSPTGSLVIGIGDLLDPARVTDPDAPNGKLLRLDPDGRGDQVPDMISMGWNNPFAFTFTPAGELWVGDNAPGDLPERIARGDAGETPEQVTELPEAIVPSGLFAPAADELLVCGYASRELTRHTIGADGLATPDGDVLARDCALDVAGAADGRIVYSGEGAIRTIER